MKIECYEDEKETLKSVFESSRICVFSQYDPKYCGRGDEGCKDCLENRIEWNVIKEGEKA